MNVRSIESVCRVVRRCVFGFSLSLSLVVSPLLADEYPTTCNYNDELCGWVEAEAEVETEAEVKTEAETEIEVDSVAVECRLTLEASIATIAAVIGEQTGVAFQQFVEPFAMVGPAIDDSVAMVRGLEQFWNGIVALHELSSPVCTDEAIAAIAALEPIDVERHGPSVLIREPETPQQSVPGIQVTPIDSLVGSAPMIVTINEPYLPYDLSASDLRLRSVFPISTKPFCVRSQVADWDIIPMWTEVEHLQIARTQTHESVPVEAKPAAGLTKTEPTALASGIEAATVEPTRPEASGYDSETGTDLSAQSAPVDCYLEEVIWLVESWAAEESRLATAFHPKSLGARFAKLVSHGNRIVYQATDLITSHWPAPIAKPSSAGRALLTRAGAETGIETVEAADALIAEAVSNQLIR